MLNFAVHGQFQHRGVGSRMLAKLIAKLSLQRRSRIVLEVRETNLAAQLFFRENGFRPVSVLHAYYNDTPEDAYHMQFRCRVDRAVQADSNNRISVWPAEKPTCPVGPVAMVVRVGYALAVGYASTSFLT